MSTFHGGKLQSLPDLLSKLNPQPPRQQSNEEILAAMRAIRATMVGGAPETHQPV